MNYALKEAGFLTGEPGAYAVTEKGAKFATEQFHQRGTGGYTSFNPSWETRTWDKSILGELDLSDDALRQIRQAVSAARAAARAARNEAAAVADTFGTTLSAREGGTLTPLGKGAVG